MTKAVLSTVLSLDGAAIGWYIGCAVVMLSGVGDDGFNFGLDLLLACFNHSFETSVHNVPL